MESELDKIKRGNMKKDILPSTAPVITNILNVIRYKNRKLYNLNASCYITLATVCKAVSKGEIIRITDYETNQDITMEILAPFVYSRISSRITIEDLHDIISSNSDIFVNEKRAA